MAPCRPRPRPTRHEIILTTAFPALDTTLAEVEIEVEGQFARKKFQHSLVTHHNSIIRYLYTASNVE